MTEKNINKNKIETHILTLFRTIDTVNASEKRICIDIIDYMREFIHKEVSEDDEIIFFIYVSNCALPYLKPLIKTIIELDQPIKTTVRVASLESIMNTVEGLLRTIEESTEYILKSQTIIDLSPEQINTEEIAKNSYDLLKKFEVLNDFERVKFV